MSLIEACEKNNLELVKQKIISGEKINIQDSMGRTPLYIACAKGNLEIVKVLIENGADINRELTNGDTPLYKACKEGDLDIVIYLINKGAQIHKRNNIGDTPLMYACLGQNTDIVKYLVDSGADVNVHNREKKTPLYLADTIAAYKVSNYLIKKGAYDPRVSIKEMYGATDLQEKCWDGNLEEVERLLDEGANINEQDREGYNVLDYACWRNDARMIDLLIDRGINLDMDMCVPLLDVAIKEEDERLIDKCIRIFENIGKNMSDGFVKLINAIEGVGKLLKTVGQKFIDKLKKFWMNLVNIVKTKAPVRERENGVEENIAEIEEYGEIEETKRIFRDRCCKGNLEEVKELVNRGLKIDEEDENGEFPLHNACFGKNPDLIKFLVESGGDINIEDVDRHTPLHIACMLGDFDIVKCLVDMGADVNKENVNRHTPLYVA